MVVVFEDNREAIARLSARCRGARLDVFGSALGEDFRLGQSDVDLLVEFDGGWASGRTHGAAARGRGRRGSSRWQPPMT